MALAVAIDWVSQFLLAPQTRNLDLSAKRGRSVVDRLLNTVRVTSISIGIEDEHAFVNVCSQCKIS